MRLPRKQRLALEQLGQDAANRPEVDSLGVLTGREHKLGCAVPPRDDVRGEIPQDRVSVLVDVRPRRQGALVRGGLVRGQPREAEVGDAQLARLVDEQVRGLEVAVHHVAALVQVGEAIEKLLGEVLDVELAELLLRPDHPSKIRVHLRNDTVEGGVLRRVDEVDDAKHVVMAEGLLNLDLTQRPLRAEVIAHYDLLDRDGCVCQLIVPRVHEPTCSSADQLGRLVARRIEV
mmetsp:Transcript_27286/g.67720  ORF Transcript_27286/g.67720 Transcript_27286/m.67720 type:complete len:232 (+) Transcript_27286:986-1681(+)